MKEILQIRLFAPLITALLLWGITSAQELIPPVLNYNTKTYNAASQNWGLSSDERGFIYVANNEGLLRYDGERWTKFQLPNKTIIRSVFYHQGKIYTGSYEEFGYWENDEFGSLKYTSLTHLIKDTFDNEEFWQIAASPQGIIFRSFGKIYLYKDDSIQAYKPSFLIASLLVTENEILLGSSDGRLFRFSDSNFTPLTKEPIASGDAINTLALLKDTVLVGTKLSGVFKLQENKLMRWGSDALHEFLLKNELNKVKIFHNQVVFGTIKGGIITTNAQGEILKNFHRGNGLQNNTVLALEVQAKTLWIGLDNGLDAIDLDAAISYYRDKSGELGAVYDVASYQHKIYLGTNTGIHFLKDNEQFFIEGSQGQVWNFSQIGEQLYGNHNRGIFKIANDKIFPVSERTGSYRLDKIPNNSDLYINSTYNGLSLYKKLRDNSLNYLQTFEAPNTPTDKVVFQDDETAWASHPYKGFFKLTLDPATGEVKNLKVYKNDSLFTAYKTSIHKIRNEICFYNAGNWFRYNTINDEIEPFNELKNYSSYSLVSDEDDFYWFKNRHGNGLVYTNFTTDSLYVYEPQIENRLIKGYDKVVKINDSINLITLYEGFAAVNINQLKREAASNDFLAPIFTGFSDENSDFPLTENDFEISHKAASSIRILVAAPQLASPLFYYTLNGRQGYALKGNIEFQNLASRDYELKIWALSNGTLSKEPLILNFTVAPAWYYSNLMLGVYACLLILIIILIYVVNRRKLNKHRQEVEQRLIKEQERNLQIAERNKLLSEINNKRKELANTTYLAAKRNRSLLEVQKELDDVKDKFDNQYKFKNIQTKINHMLEGKDNWKVFETNFSEINDDFFHDLLQKYPSLSTKDLKLCAYLKMNLTTKEIAPLMAISVRGVEIHRYRLRKKLNLKSGKSLSKFLISNY